MNNDDNRLANLRDVNESEGRERSAGAECRSEVPERSAGTECRSGVPERSAGAERSGHAQFKLGRSGRYEAIERTNRTPA